VAGLGGTVKMMGDDTKTSMSYARQFNRRQPREQSFRVCLRFLTLLLFLIRVSSVFDPWLPRFFRVIFFRVFRAPSSEERGVVESRFIFLPLIFLPHDFSSA
jgi:hypothetical protein